MRANQAAFAPLHRQRAPVSPAPARPVETILDKEATPPLCTNYSHARCKTHNIQEKVSPLAHQGDWLCRPHESCEAVEVQPAMPHMRVQTDGASRTRAPA
jgi:hypothetical protein